MLLAWYYSNPHIWNLELNYENSENLSKVTPVYGTSLYDNYICKLHLQVAACGLAEYKTNTKSRVKVFFTANKKKQAHVPRSSQYEWETGGQLQMPVAAFIMGYLEFMQDLPMQVHVG